MVSTSPPPFSQAPDANQADLVSLVVAQDVAEAAAASILRSAAFTLASDYLTELDTRTAELAQAREACDALSADVVTRGAAIVDLQSALEVASAGHDTALGSVAELEQRLVESESSVAEMQQALLLKSQVMATLVSDHDAALALLSSSDQVLSGQLHDSPPPPFSEPELLVLPDGSVVPSLSAASRCAVDHAARGALALTAAFDSRLAEQTSLVTELHRQLASAHDHSTGRANRVALLTESLAELTARNFALEATVAEAVQRATEATVDLAALTASRTAAESKSESLRVDFDSQRVSHAATLAELSDGRAELEVQLAASSDEVGRLQRELDELRSVSAAAAAAQSGAHASALAALQEQVETLSAAHTASESEVARLREESGVLAQVLVDARAASTAATLEVETLRARHTHVLDELSCRLRDATSALDVVTAERDSLRADLVSAQEAAGRLAAAEAAVGRVAAEASDRLSAASAQWDVVARERDSAIVARDALTADLDAVVAQRDAAVADLEAAVVATAELQAQLEASAHQLSTISEERDALASHAAAAQLALREENSRVAAQLAASEDAQLETASRATALEQKVLELATAVESERANAETAKAAAEEAAHALAAAEKAAECNRADLEGLETEHQQQVYAFSMEKSSLAAANERLQTDLSAAQQQAEELGSQLAANATVTSELQSRLDVTLIELASAVDARDASAAKLASVSLALEARDAEALSATASLSAAHDQLSTFEAALGEFEAKVLDAERNLDEARSTAAESTAAVDALRAQLSAVQEDLTATKSAARSASLHSLAQFAACEVRFAELTAQLTSAKRQSDASADVVRARDLLCADLSAQLEALTFQSTSSQTRLQQALDANLQLSDHLVRSRLALKSSQGQLELFQQAAASARPPSTLRPPSMIAVPLDTEALPPPNDFRDEQIEVDFADLVDASLQLLGEPETSAHPRPIRRRLSLVSPMNQPHGLMIVDAASPADTAPHAGQAPSPRLEQKQPPLTHPRAADISISEYDEAASATVTPAPDLGRVSSPVASAEPAILPPVSALLAAVPTGLPAWARTVQEAQHGPTGRVSSRHSAFHSGESAASLLWGLTASRQAQHASLRSLLAAIDSTLVQ
jgi:chromosome segregation ATPase